MNEYRLIIESILIQIRPNFLDVSYIDSVNTIHVIISHKLFRDMIISDRVSYIFSLLIKNCPDILEKVTVVVECFSSEEMNSLFELMR